MGLRGPQPTPSAIKHARGTFRPDRAAGNEASPLGKPKTPKWLSPDAKKEYRRIVKLLTDMGLIGAADENALVRYANTWVRWRRAVQLIEKAGELVAIKWDDNGKAIMFQTSPMATTASNLADQLSRLEQAFGMSPAARSRINVTPPPSTSPANTKSRFFDGTGDN